MSFLVNPYRFSGDDIPTGNLVFYTRCDNSVTDETGNHTPTTTDITYGSIVSAPPSGTHFAEFDLTTSKITIPDSDLLSFGDGASDSPFSITFWLYYNVNTGSPNFITKGANSASGAREYRIWSGTTILAQFFDASTGGQIRAGIAKPAEGAWNFFTMTYDGSGSETGIKWYKNAVDGTTGATSSGSYTAMENLTDDVTIGKNPANVTGSLDGDMDSIGIWNKELSQAEITAIYNSENAGNNLL